MVQAPLGGPQCLADVLTCLEWEPSFTWGSEEGLGFSRWG